MTAANDLTNTRLNGAIYAPACPPAPDTIAAAEDAEPAQRLADRYRGRHTG